MNITDTVRHLLDAVTVTDVIVSVPGIIVIGVWLYRTSVGRTALVESVPRRNNMPVYLPFVPLLIWLAILVAGEAGKEKLWSGLADWHEAFFDNVVLCAAAVIATVEIVILARASFTRRLKGFGLNIKTLPKDFFVGLLNLVSIYPLVAAALLITIFYGKLLWGENFELQKHQELERIAQYPQWSLRLLIVIVTILVVPVFEELLFRGMLQTMICSFLPRTALGKKLRSKSAWAWLAIVITSILFAAFHSTAGHWPALFVLAICLGYSYEKSGSLFRPIFIHSFFNAASVTVALYQ